MKTLRSFLTILLLNLYSLTSFAQTTEVTPEMKESVRLYNAKINELIDRHSKNGFTIIKESKLPLRNAIDMVIHVPLHEGDWYHFCFVGDPTSRKIKATLFLNGLGDLVQDRIIVRRENEFWTEFSFICPQTGNYELTLFQKAEVSKPLSYLTIFKRDRTVSLN